MSISLLSNLSATFASSNMATSSSLLQQSLNRLSSGQKIVKPGDDAGGLAVSMKMGAAIKRQAAASSNISNAMSYLQTQDGALKQVGEILDRMGELKTLSQDVTKNETDKANYNREFATLQEQISSLSEQKFNGVSLFSASALSVKTSVDGSGQTVDVGGVDLLGGMAPQNLFSDSFDGSSLSSDWTVNSGPVSVSSNIVSLDLNEKITLNQTFSEDVNVSFDINLDVGGGVYVDGASGRYFTPWAGSDVSTNSWHNLSFQLKTDGTLTDPQLDGVGFSPLSGIATNTPGNIGFAIGNQDFPPAQVRNLSIESANSVSTSNSTGDVTSAVDLVNVSIDDLKAATEEVASARATNGAQFSRLQFAQEQLNVNQTNLESANSRISDVDIAFESTEMARFNILQQAGAAMLQQANQSQQIALRLLG